ncbi:MAG: T9SS type A sorting domain-containing protein [candidate division KSB1 bacterium]|nr:T9SS type A sorting domain-containing protein [candidate division KSB1 bacterium]
MKILQVISFLMFQLSLMPVFAQQWSAPVAISEKGWQSYLAIDKDDQLHLVFTGPGEMDSTKADIFYTYFNGTVWTIPVNLSCSERDSWDPRLIIDDNNRVHVIWEDICLPKHPPGPADLFYCCYQNGVWSDPISLDRDDGEYKGFNISNPVLDSDQRVHLMWDHTPWLKYTYIENGLPSDIQNIQWGGLQPDIHVDSKDKIHVAYIDVQKIPIPGSHERSDVFYFYYSEADSVWSDSVMVYRNPNQYSFVPQITTDACGRIHIVWLEDEDLDALPNDVYHSFSDDGVNWTEAYDISHAGGNCYFFDMVIDSKGHLHVVWDQAYERYRFSVDHIWYAFFNGESWSEPQRITSTGRWMGERPTIAVDSQDYLHLVWHGRLYEGEEGAKLLYSTTRPTTKVVSQEEVNPVTDFQLFQNFPNPFNATTNIIFSIPSSTEVSLTIFDLEGRGVKKLLAEQMLSPGTYRVPWDSTDETGKRVASGVYLYQLKAGNFTETRKMILLF